MDCISLIKSKSHGAGLFGNALYRLGLSIACPIENSNRIEDSEKIAYSWSTLNSAREYRLLIQPSKRKCDRWYVQRALVLSYVIREHPYLNPIWLTMLTMKQMISVRWLVLSEIGLCFPSALKPVQRWCSDVQVSFSSGKRSVWFTGPYPASTIW